MDAIRATSSIADCASFIEAVVEAGAEATAPMFSAIWSAETAASETLRFISVVVAVCSSTAAAMVLCESLIRPMICEISLIAWTAPSVSDWMGGGDVLGGLRRLLSELLDLVGDDGKALARPPGPPRSWR